MGTQTLFTPEIEKLRTPWPWEAEIAHNLNNLGRCQEIALESDAAFTVYLPERTAERVGELALIETERIKNSRTVMINDLPTTSRFHLALTGGGLPYASALGVQVHRLDARTPYRLGTSKMSRYGNKQTGSESLNIEQPPIASDIDDMDTVLVDDLIDRGKTLMLSADHLMKKGVPFSEVLHFLNVAFNDYAIKLSTYDLLVEMYSRLSGKKSTNDSTEVAKPRSISASVLVDKQYNPDLSELFDSVDIGMYAPKVWLKRMGMDGPNEDGRWGEGIVVSGTQELVYADEMAKTLEIVGGLAVMTMDGKNPITWLDEDGRPAKLPKRLL